MSREPLQAGKVKVFGERNTGTNLVERLLRSDAGLRVLPSVAPHGVRWLAAHLGAERESTLDWWERLSRWRTLGWKHAYLTDELLDALAERRVRAVMTVKHPLSWLVSLRRHPYHLAVGPDGEPRHQYLGRERLPRDPASLLDIWELKAGRFVAAEERRVGVILRFEDLVRDPAARVSEGLVRLGLPALSSPLAPVQSVKHDHRSSSEIRDYYERESWRSSITDADLDGARRLDGALLERLGYR